MINEVSWEDWLQETIDCLDARYEHIRAVHAENWERRSWRAWQAGRTACEFVEEFLRDHKKEW